MEQLTERDKMGILSGMFIVWCVKIITGKKLKLDGWTKNKIAPENLHASTKQNKEKQIPSIQSAKKNIPTPKKDGSE